MKILGVLFCVMISVMLQRGITQIPDSLVAEGLPAIPEALRADAARYLEFRAANFNGWHPRERQMLITTRFADSMQLHAVKTPGGARKQLTFLSEPVLGGVFQPDAGEYIVFLQDKGGSEFYQLYRYDLDSGKITLLTDGKSRNTGASFSYSGQRLAYSSTRRTGKDTDIYVMDPKKPGSEHLVLEVSGGGWRVEDWAHDDSKLLIGEYVSINESYVYSLDLKTKEKTPLTPRGTEKVAYSAARFSPDGKTVYFVTDKHSEFQRLIKMDLTSKKDTILTADIKWDVDDLALSQDGTLIAFITNEDGVGVLHLMDAKTGKERKAPKLPLGAITNLRFHENNRDLGFNLSSAKSPSDAYSLDVKSGKVERWTESETGGLNPENFVEPEMLSFKSFDDIRISGFIYRPDPKKFSGKRPVIINIHGGPESQARPIFQARNNYYLNELGVAMIYPNVRGSAGYGKTFLTLDNGFKREDSVKDIGALIEWIKRDARLDAKARCSP
jgi:dipeptidyl aminopeptidase/acylaminoacyl peptidase